MGPPTPDLSALIEQVRSLRKGVLDNLPSAVQAGALGDLAREINGMARDLRSVDQMKRDLVSGVTHDLGTSLHSMRAAVNYLASGKAGALSEAQADYLLILSNSVEFLSQFIHNLLQTARIDAGKADPYYEAIDPGAAASELVRLYLPQAQERGLALDLRLPDKPVIVMADALQFRQMLLNLVTNALKFTDQGRVEVSLAREEGWLVVRVKDTGIGIDPGQQALIFDKFYRVRPGEGEAKRQGTDLGLAIAKGLAEAHGGSLTLESSPGQGSTFTLRLPRTREAA